VYLQPRRGLSASNNYPSQTIQGETSHDHSAERAAGRRGARRADRRVAEAAISGGDPASNWEEFEAWLRQRLAGEALENYAMFVRRAQEVAAAVSEHFACAEGDVIGVREVAAPVELIARFAVDSGFVGKTAKGAGLVTFQKACSGLLMFTMLTRLAALAIPAPFGLAAAVLMGRAGFNDERRRRLEQRRGAAKAAVRRFVDDFNLQVGKDSRDAVRHVQRELRNAWAGRVSELQRSASQALAAAQASRADTESAGPQRERIDTDLASLALLRARMDDLAAHRQRTKTPPTPANPARRRVRARGSAAGAGRPAATGAVVTRPARAPAGPSPLLGAARALVCRAGQVYEGGPAMPELHAAAARLDEPLRVAIAGRIKAGKSTLLNALAGQELAATGAGECTRIVTWYRDGHSYRVMACPHSGPPRPLPPGPAGGVLDVSLGGLRAEEADRLVVDWPSAALSKMTLVDTPGMDSLSTELSRRAETTLGTGGEDEQAEVDAVVYLMRHRHGSDVQFLETFRNDPAERRPINTIAVLGRADEIGHGRVDALESAARVAARYQQDPRLQALCQTVLPVAGFLAAAAATLREDEFRAITTLAQAGEAELERLLVTAARFTGAQTGIAVDPARRAALLDRFGFFGLRLSVRLVQNGVATTAAALSRAVGPRRPRPAARRPDRALRRPRRRPQGPVGVAGDRRGAAALASACRRWPAPRLRTHHRRRPRVRRDTPARHPPRRGVDAHRPRKDRCLPRARW
jgi:50S ribosome-binding GTPase